MRQIGRDIAPIKLNITKRQIRRNIAPIVGSTVLLVWILLALLAPVIVPYDPVAMHTDDSLLGPNTRYLLGTDEFGRDVFSRLIFGARISLFIGAASVAFCAVFGGTLGLVAGYWGKTIDSILMRMMDVIMSFPAIFLAIAIMAFLGPGLTNTIIAITIVYSPSLFRVTRGAVLAVRELDYVESARATGCSHVRIVVKHILPQVTAPMTVEMTLRLSAAMLTEAALSFLGLGTQPPYASWGSMIADADRFMSMAPWLIFFPGMAIVSAVLAFNFVGDGLRDILDVRLRKD